MTLNPINPADIQRRQNYASRPAGAKAMEFGDFLAGVSAMNPFATELTHQATGNVNAATVLNAAFASFPAAASAFSGGGGGGAPSWAAAGGSPYGMAQQWYPPGGPGGMPGLGSHYPMGALGEGGSNQVVPGTNMTQFQMMEMMNQNNLRLIELQALMQSNMQVWNTKSNILSADHRAKMSMIEKFTARG